MLNFKPVLFFIYLFLILSLTISAKGVTQVDIIFDGSGSMWGKMGKSTKIQIARKALKNLLTHFEKNRKDIHLGLRVYGHKNKRCSNSILETKIGKNSIPSIKQVIKKVNPLGKTPISYSLSKAVKDFDHSLKGKKEIILITDGIESCGGDICKTALELKKAGIVTNIHVVGFGMTKKELSTLNCITKPFGGEVIGANSSKELVDSFKKITDKVSSIRNLKVESFDTAGKKVYIDIEAYKKGKKVGKAEGTVGFLSLKPGVYDIKGISRDTSAVVYKKGVKIKGKKLKVIKLVFKEGTIKLRSINSDDKDIYAFYTFYSLDGKKQFLKTQGKGVVTKKITPGVYDLKIFEQDTNSILWRKNIEIKPGKTFEQTFKFEMGTIKITPKNGSGKISKEYWWYYIYPQGEKNKLKNSPEGVGGKSLKALPGLYTVKVLDGYNKVVKTVENVKIEAKKVTDISVQVPK